MEIRFDIHYRTVWGQRPGIMGSLKQLGSNNPAKAPMMNTVDGENWYLIIEVPEKDAHSFTYKYFIHNEDNNSFLWEWGDDRAVGKHAKSSKSLCLNDFWRATQREENALYTSAFKNILLKRDLPAIDTKKNGKTPKKLSRLRFQICVPHVSRKYDLCIIGSASALGAWDESKAILMDGKNHPFWHTDIVLGEKDFLEPTSYKYGIYDKATGEIVEWETGADRRIDLSGLPQLAESLTVRTDEAFRFPNGNWRGTGVVIPVFSLRSNQSLGIGEFLDLKPMADWAKNTGLNMIQILPVNDTTAHHSWLDSYPYSAISVFALNPVYLNLEALGKSKDKKASAVLLKKKEELNKLEHVDYGEVIKIKEQYIRSMFLENKAGFLRSKAFKLFFAENEHWIKRYAAFCYLRDLYKTPDFTQWKEFSTFSEKKLEGLCDPKSPHYDEIALHYFTQFHLHKQLLEASDYARSKGVILKGDIPIGIYRHSVDAWVAPELYNMNAQAGAPPDAFAAQGQNWGFPTYNWETMAKDGYAWWTDRLKQLSKYFDAFRIDHILGFFRIWEIPYDSVEGLLGHFNPATPISQQEITDRGIPFDYNRYCKPYIREHMLHDIFGDEAEYVKHEFLNEYDPGYFELKPRFDTQRKVEAFLASDQKMPKEMKSKREFLRAGLYRLISEVIFIPSPSKDEGEGYHPRVTFHDTYSFRELDDWIRHRLDELYIDYFYRRQEGLWQKQAMVKLPAVKDATKMLICGEDLGMVPASVPNVMSELGILGLNIQRMPKDPSQEFFYPNEAPYLSVVSPSSHDMSTIRGWWEEERDTALRFYHNVLGKSDEAPYICEPGLVEEVIAQHLFSPAMWAVFPLQDLMGMDAHIRREDPHEEQINIPSNPKHYWRYRMHLSLEELQDEVSFNNRLRSMIEKSGRLHDD
ncbi:4-alpha-glucanotransferase [Fulvitalea axinellae]|uniref:4-alpha-glucanotransferase n=1 Tax=Fulvitalea axinellae TaxID=1182444 RepID=A0AAU9CNT2_9BACT|nr:4-alpha-glucanotransferase [Fulvitalea axinellae]